MHAARFPSHVEARYRRYLRRRVEALAKLVRTEVLPALQPDAGAVTVMGVTTVRADALDWRTLLSLLTSAFATANPVPEDLLRGLVSQVDESVTSPLLAVGVMPIPTAPGSLDWFAKNTALIRSIDEQLLADVATVLATAQAQGWSQRTAARQLTARTGVALSRAKIIARDQIATLNGALTKQRQTELGVRDFIWRTSQDERVRSSHEALEGRRFSWAQPPAEGFPGQPILCRCTAEPVLDEIAPRRG